MTLEDGKNMPVIFESSSETPVNHKNHKPSAVDSERDILNIKPKATSLWSYMQWPRHIHFATQTPDETIILFIRQHPITQIPWILITAMLVAAPVFLVPVARSMAAPYAAIPLPYIIVSIVFWYLITYAYAFISFLLWYYNINIVTNKRIIDIDFIYLLVQEVTATRIAQVEDVTYRRVGSFATLFDYGNVFVQTAGAEVKIECIAVPQPRQISKIIIDLLGTVTPST
ncbi:hypothetical protein A3B56_01970 [Candidatus Roizmanbacteria bacterium RIFCSPLOWO2_01_FULL_45_11]|uniref:DUF304 domain-containing protein n=1 Tax=Candidatus Roizmanbacteria bacterium RIFCSPLOWO2_01_FULL_45_11 TaxID=1802070 RepID=A0A1F7JI63_9BACT|nr:MAG: hypothetical protein A3B56_01970 [Candidatus Roizmanbacteria bacterium RIFCSPLOWO2_01_FULL_45_11]